MLVLVIWLHRITFSLLSINLFHIIFLQKNLTSPFPTRCSSFAFFIIMRHCFRSPSTAIPVFETVFNQSYAVKKQVLPVYGDHISVESFTFVIVKTIGWRSLQGLWEAFSEVSCSDSTAEHLVTHQTKLPFVISLRQSAHLSRRSETCHPQEMQYKTVPGTSSQHLPTRAVRQWFRESRQQLSVVTRGWASGMSWPRM